MDPKAIHKSVTAWLNVLALVAGLIVTIDPALVAALPDQLKGAVVAIISGANLYLRIFKTSQPIAAKVPDSAGDV